MKLHKKKVSVSSLSPFNINRGTKVELPRKKNRLTDLPVPVLEKIIKNVESKDKQNLCRMCRKLRIIASKLLWERLTLTNLPTRRQSQHSGQIFINKYTFRTFFEDVYMGKLNQQLSWVKHFIVLYKEDELVNTDPLKNPETSKNLNYVPIQNFFHWFLNHKAQDLMLNTVSVSLSINIGSNAMAEAIRTLCWSLPKARVKASFWIPGFAGIAAKDLITPNMQDLEIKCDLMNFSFENIFSGDFCIPKKCQVFRLGLEDNLRFELKLKAVPPRPKIKAELLSKWLRKCDQLHTLELAHVDIVNPQALDWSPACFAKIDTTSLILQEVEFYPPKQAVMMRHVNLLDRVNVRTRPLMELLTPHLISVEVSALKATEEQLTQLVHWFKFHKPTLQKITLSHMTYSQLKTLLPQLASMKYKMIDLFELVPDQSMKFVDLAEVCVHFRVLKIQMKNISIEQATSFLKYIYFTQHCTLSSVRVVDGPFTPSTLPHYVFDNPRQFQLLETKSLHRRITTFEKSSAPTTPTSL